MLCYLLHLYLIHLLALALGLIASQPLDWLLPGASGSAGRAEGFGFDLWVVHVIWVAAVAIEGTARAALCSCRPKHPPAVRFQLRGHVQRHRPAPGANGVRLQLGEAGLVNEQTTGCENAVDPVEALKAE